MLGLALPATAALDVPPLSARVVDRAELLSARERQALESELAAFEGETGSQIVVHTTPSLEGLDIETYSVEIAEAWKVGRKELDDGVILTVAPNQRKMRIEVGYGLEGVIPDVIAARIIREDITPAFREQRFGDGIRIGVARLKQAARGEALPPPTRGAPRGSSGFSLIVTLIFVALILTQRWWTAALGVGALSAGHHRYRGGWGGGGGGFGGGGFGGGGFGGGGFGGGGGGFGGGGASGGW